MTREIKFRAWDKESKFMTFDDGFTIRQLNVLPKLEVMQFTGLKDKNGKEIYENDLLKDEGGKVREVVWYELGAGWRVGTDEKDTLFNGLGVYADRLEVVGNKYEG